MCFNNQVKWRKIWSFWENNEEIYIGSGDVQALFTLIF